MSRPLVGLTVLALLVVAFLAWQLFATHRRTQEQLAAAQRLQDELKLTLHRQDARSKSWGAVNQRLEELERRLRALASRSPGDDAQETAVPDADADRGADLELLTAEISAIREELASLQTDPPPVFNGSSFHQLDAGVVLTIEPVAASQPQIIVQGQTTPNGSNPGALRWDVDQFLGEPDSPAGDQATAWASKDPDGGEEWIEAEFAAAVTPDSILVRESFNPGAVVRVEALDSAGEWHAVWSGTDPTDSVPENFVVPGSSFPTKVVRVTLDTTLVKGWNEIDAVGLVVGDRTYWAVAGGASSSWAERYDR